MKIKDVLGKKIVGVNQERFWNHHTDSWCIHVKGFTLSDGSYIHFSTIETGSDYATAATVTKSKKTETV